MCDRSNGIGAQAHAQPLTPVPLSPASTQGRGGALRAVMVPRLSLGTSCSLQTALFSASDDDADIVVGNLAFERVVDRLQPTIFAHMQG